MSKKIISLAEAIARLGDDVVICLEPNSTLTAKVDGGKTDELWVFDPTTGRMGRGDGRFFAVDGYVDRGGWGHPGVIEEPGLPFPEDGPRIIGHVIVEVNGSGLVRARDGKGLNGPILELAPSSISKGDLAGDEETPIGFVEANPQRIGGGLIAVYLHHSDFADADGITPDNFRKRSTDGRSLSALAKCGL